ncbi:MAG: hypothetical protein WCG93_08290 [Paludibacter sp.]
MTAQQGEILLYKGKKTTMASEPLNEYLDNRKDIRFFSPHTACWRGYFGKWKIAYKKLYLTHLVAYIEGYEVVDLNYLFPGQKNVFANWFSGVIIIPQGEMLEYRHMGYESIFESELLLTFKEGVLMEEKVIYNQ